MTIRTSNESRRPLKGRSRAFIHLAGIVAILLLAAACGSAEEGASEASSTTTGATVTTTGATVTTTGATVTTTGAAVTTTGATDTTDAPIGQLEGQRLGIPSPISVDLLNDWYATMGEAAEASGNGLEVVVVDAGADQATQIADAERFIAQGAAALYVVSFTSEGWGPVVELADEMGVGFFNATAEPMTPVVQNVVVEHFEGGLQTGRVAGKWLKEHYGTDGEVGMLDFPDDSFHSQRAVGFLQGVRESLPGVNSHVVRSEADTESGATNAANLLQAHPNIRVMFVWTDPAALGAVQAVNEAGRTSLDEFFLASVDGGTDVVELIQSGTSILQATAGFSFPYIAVAALTDIENWLLGHEVAPTRIIKARLITGENADAELELLLNPLAPENAYLYDGILTGTSDEPTLP